MKVEDLIIELREVIDDAKTLPLSGSRVPGMTGTPQATAIFLASSLSPILARTELGGPMNLMPASSQARAKAAFSERKP